MEKTTNLDHTLTKLDNKRAVLKTVYDKSIFWHFFFPTITLVGTAAASLFPPLIFITTGVLALISYGVYRMNIGGPFEEIKNQVKAAVLREFMKTFHPEIDYTYHASKQQVKAITDRSDLVSANRFEEEDVIEGRYGNTEFYISEVHLRKKGDKSTRTILDGILLRIKLPAKSFRHSRIQSEIGLLSELFGHYKQHEEHGFYYDTSHEDLFLSELENLFPFINHLMKKQGDIRISIKDSEIIILMESEMQLLDDPKPSLARSFKNKVYNENIARQMNTLLFIVESFSKGYSSEDIEGRLELDSLKLAEKIELRNQ